MSFKKKKEKGKSERVSAQLTSTAVTSRSILGNTHWSAPKVCAATEEGPLQPQGLALERSWEGMHRCTPGKKGLPHCTEHLSGNRKGRCKFSSCWAWKPASRQKEIQVHPSFQQGKKILGACFLGRISLLETTIRNVSNKLHSEKKNKHTILMASKSVEIQEEEMDLLLQGWNYSF